MNRTVLTSFIILCLLSTLSLSGLAFEIRSVKADSGTIYIRADGSVEPPTANITTIDNVTYTFVGNVYGEIVVERDNIVVDGEGHVIEGAGSGTGMSLNGRNNVIIQNVTAEGFSVGILLDSSNHNSILGSALVNDYYNGVLRNSSNNIIQGNTIANGSIGIRVDESSDNSIQANMIRNNSEGINLYFSSSNVVSGNMFVDDGLRVSASYGNVVVNNIVNGKPLAYLENVSKFTVEDAGQVILINCQDIIVENLNLSSATVGVHLSNTNNTRIQSNTISENGWVGIELDRSSSNVIQGNTVTDNHERGGITLSWYSNNNVLQGNTITNQNSGSQMGIHVADSSDNRILGNTMENNIIGISMERSSNNSAQGNTLTTNSYGIDLFYSSNSEIVHNDFINNTKQFHTFSSTSVWHAGYPSGGNYWSDYVGVDSHNGPYQNETGYDWIGDTPYVIDADNIDRYPLMHPFESETQEIEVAYRNLLGYYDNLLGSFNTLNASYQQHLQDYSDIQRNYTSLQNSYTSLQANFGSLNSAYNDLQSSLNTLNSSYNNLNSTFNDYKTSTQKELSYTRNFVYVLTAIAIILIVGIVYLAVRKPKTRPET